MGKRFALVSPCGHGNLGDAAIQQAVIHHIRLRFPDASILGITLKPSDTESRHGIPSCPIAAISKPQYLVLTSSEQDHVDAAVQKLGKNAVLRCIQMLLSVPVNAARLLLPRGWPWLIRTETIHIVNAFKVLRDVDFLIFSGGGQLDDFWGGPWGHLYALFKWTLLARLVGARVLFLSVGFGSLESRTSRILARLALSLANYRSYRDPGSRDLMRQAGFRHDDPVYPDLAYSLPARGRQTSGELKRKVERRVGVCPMVYCDPRSWPRKDSDAYKRYLKKLTEAVIWLLHRDYKVLLFASDGPDWRTVDELRDLVLSQISNGKRSGIEVASASTVDEFIMRASSVEIVVASRLHGVILAHLAGTPVLALSYDRKVYTLMEHMEQTRFCLNIDHFQMPCFQETFLSLEAESFTSEKIRSCVTEYRNLLERQFDNTLLSTIDARIYEQCQ